MLSNVHTLAADMEHLELRLADQEAQEAPAAPAAPVADEQAPDTHKRALAQALSDQETLILVVKQFEQELKTLREQNSSMTSCHQSFHNIFANFGKSVARNRKKVAGNLDAMGPQRQRAAAARETLSHMLAACSDSLLAAMKKLGIMLHEQQQPCHEHIEGNMQ